MVRNDRSQQTSKVYPFSGELKTPSGASLGLQVVKLSSLGLMAEMLPSQLQTGEEVECVLSLPILNKTITERMKVIKIYHHWAAQRAASPPASPAKEKSTSDVKPDHLSSVHLVELHFLKISAEGRKTISAVLGVAGGAVS